MIINSFVTTWGYNRCIQHEGYKSYYRHILRAQDKYANTTNAILVDVMHNMWITLPRAPKETKA